MKKLIIMLIAVVFFGVNAFAVEKKAEENGEKKGKQAITKEESAESVKEEENGAGVTFGITYWSKYLWRGMDFYNGDGVLFPTLSWEVFGTGLKLSAVAEVSESWMFNGFQKKPKKYYLSWEEPYIVKKQLKYNHTAYSYHGLDFGGEYSYTVKDAVTIGCNLWYYWYYNSKRANELAWPKYESVKVFKHWDWSYLSAGFNIGIDAVPYINPVIAVFYDHYTGMKRGGDYYVQLSFSHDYEIVKDVVSIKPAITAGYYYGASYKYHQYYLASVGGTDFDFTEDYIWMVRSPLRKGVSDITPSVTMTVTKGDLSLTSGFFWVIVPAKSWYKGGSVHRYYASLGISYTI